MLHFFIIADFTGIVSSVSYKTQYAFFGFYNQHQISKISTALKLAHMDPKIIL